jgi:3-oxoacyl-[acyl-carrier-protein] synthase II
MRVWITGLGVVSPLGAGAHRTMEALCAGERAIGEATLFDVSAQRTRLAAEVRALRVRDVAPAAQAESWSRVDAFACAAAREALEQARLAPDRMEIDLVVGGTTGPMFETEELLAALGPQSRWPPAVSRSVTHPLSWTAERLHASLGPFRRTRTLSSACSTGANALLLAAAWIRTGRSARVLAGASDGLCRLTFTGFNALGSLDEGPCRPFDRRRAGLTLGEGAAFLVLESERAARERGAEPIAELCGWASGAEAHHITNPEPHGATAARVMRAALEAARLPPSAIDHVNAHGTATRLNDPMEIRALRAVLGDDADRAAVCSCKGQIGHALGASGAIEAAVCALSVAESRVPPTGGLADVDPECAAGHVIGRARVGPVRAAMSNAFGFGGLDTVLVFARPDLAPEPERPARRAVAIVAGAWIGPGGAAQLQVAVPGGAGGRHAESTAEPRAGESWRELTRACERPGLDPARARRLGRPERMIATCVSLALRERAWPEGAPDAERTGLVVGMASGSLEGASRFLARARDKGPRLAPPADFPSLMVSASAGHVSIYQGLRGPVLAVSEHGCSGEAGAVTAVELVDAGEADWVVAAGADEWSQARAWAAAGLAPGTGAAAPRTDGAACVVFAARELATGPPVAAVVARAESLSSLQALREAAAVLPAPRPRSRVLLAGEVPEGVLHASPWAAVPAAHVESAAGRYEGAGVAALVAGASIVAADPDADVLVVATSEDRGCLFVLCPP